MMKKKFLIYTVVIAAVLLIGFTGGIHAKYVVDAVNSFELDIHKWKTQEIVIGRDPVVDQLHVKIDEHGAMTFVEHEEDDPDDWGVIVGIEDGWDTNLGIEKSSITSVVFPDTLTFIGENAFSGASLSSVEIPNAVTSIGASAFENVSTLTTVTMLGNNITLGAKAFLNCSNFSSMTVAGVDTSDIAALIKLDTFTSGTSTLAGKGSNPWFRSDYPSEIKDGVFYQVATQFNSGLKKMLVKFPVARTDAAFTIPDDVSTVDRQAFSRSKITDIDLNKINIIGEQAFATCLNLTSIHIPASVTKIKGSAFINCKAVKTLTFDPNVKLVEFGGWAFSNQSLEGTVILPANMPSILYEGMFHVSGSAHIVVPEGVKEIKGKAFGQTNARSITLPSTVTTIAANAFWNKAYGSVQDTIIYYNGSATIPSDLWIGDQGSSSHLIVVNTSGLSGVSIDITGRKESSGYTVSLTGSTIPTSVTVTDDQNNSQTYAVTNGTFNIPYSFTSGKIKLTLTAVSTADAEALSVQMSADAPEYLSHPAATAVKREDE